MQMARAGATLLGVLLFASLAGLTAGKKDCYHDIVQCCNQTIKKEGPYISPSQLCRREVRKANMPCVCHILTAYDERIVSPEKLVRCAHDSGVDLPVGSKCGSKQTRSSNWRHQPPPPHYQPPDAFNRHTFRHPPPPPPHHHPPTSWNRHSFRHPPPPPPNHHPPASWNGHSFRYPPPPPPHHHPPATLNGQSFRYPPPPPPHHQPAASWNGQSFRHPPPPPPHHQPPRSLRSSIRRGPAPPYSKPHA